MIVSCEEYIPEEAPRIDVDEATGRVVLWGQKPGAKDTTSFVGNLVWR